MKRIGIIGRGFVGSAVEFGFSAQTGCDAIVKVYDKNSKLSLNTLTETINDSEFIFVSVPTPSNPDGSINLEILNDVLMSINDVNNSDSIILIRSTIVPGTTQKFINQSRFILGGEHINTDRVATLFRWRFGESVPIIQTNFETAELIKYMNNCFFATKVSFLNEMKLISDKVGSDWNTAIEGFVRDGRIGHSHLSVPGPDGKLGFGGSCFPKDIQAIITFAKNLDIELNTLKGVWDTNLSVRPDKDWQKLKGRSIT
jgi:UDPglucose 6-dehydrogenase